MIEDILRINKRCYFGDEIGKTHDLTLGEVECISAIARNEELTSKNLSSILELSPSRGSRIVNKLVERNFVKTRFDSHDRRTVLLSLTQKGHECYLELEEEKHRCEQRLFAQLDEEQLHVVEQGLHILLNVI